MYSAIGGKVLFRVQQTGAHRMGRGGGTPLSGEVFSKATREGKPSRDTLEGAAVGGREAKEGKPSRDTLECSAVGRRGGPMKLINKLEHHHTCSNVRMGVFNCTCVTNTH